MLAIVEGVVLRPRRRLLQRPFGWPQRFRQLPSDHEWL